MRCGHEDERGGVLREPGVSGTSSRYGASTSVHSQSQRLPFAAPLPVVPLPLPVVLPAEVLALVAAAELVLLPVLPVLPVLLVLPVLPVACPLSVTVN